MALEPVGTEGRNDAPTQGLRGSNQSGMRAYNQKLVLSLVYSHGSLSKTDIARMTGLSAQTVSVIMRELEAEDLLVKGDPIRGKVGQPQVPLSINPEGAFFLGLKVGRRSAELVLLDFLGDPKATLRESYPWPTPAAIIEFVRGGLAGILAAMAPAQRQRVAGLGIAMPFQLWNWSEQAGAPREKMDAWRHVDLRTEIAALCDFPVYCQNDATAACAAELIFGTHKGLKDFVYLYVGTFIGGGIVLNGSIHSGRTGNAGVLAPMPVTGPEGRPVQLLELASIMTLERRMRAAGRDPSPLWESPDDWTGLESFIDEWIEGVAYALAYAIVAAGSIIDFEHAVIDGGLPADVRRRLVARTRAEIARFDTQGMDVPVIVEGTIGEIARALGAASLPLFDRYLLDRNLLLGEAG